MVSTCIVYTLLTGPDRVKADVLIAVSVPSLSSYKLKLRFPQRPIVLE